MQSAAGRSPGGQSRVATVVVEVATHGLGRLGGPARGTARAEVRPECLLGCATPTGG